MHEIMGFTLAEWGSIVALLTAGGALVDLIAKATTTMNNVNNTLSKLNDMIQRLNNHQDATDRQIESIHGQINRLEDKFEVHIGEAKVRNQRITALEKEIFNHENHK